MRRLLCFISFLIAINTFGQAKHRLTTFLSFQLNKTVYDRTIKNNSAGFGFGVESILNTKTIIKPVLQLNADIFGGTKNLYTTLDGRPIYAKQEVGGVFIGPMYQPTKRLFITTTFGLNFYNSKVYSGVRPSLGFYTSDSKKCMLKASYTNIFQRDNISDEGFGFFSFALSLKLF